MPTAVANGKTFKFPDGTTPEQMGQAIDEFFTAQPQQSTQPSMQDVKPTNSVDFSQSNRNLEAQRDLAAQRETGEQPGVLQSALIGMGRGFTDLGEGVKQRALEAGVKTNLVDPQALTNFEQQVKNERATYDSTPVGAESTAADVGRFVGNAAPQILIPGGVAGNLAKRAATGALAGVASGAAQFAEDAEDLTANMAMGGVFGGATPAVISGLKPAAKNMVKLVMRGGEAGQKALQEALQQFDSIDVNPNLPQAAGGFTQTLAALTRRLPGGGPLMKSIEDANKAIQSRLAKDADYLSTKQGADTAGNTIVQAIKGEDGFLSRFREKSNFLWTKVDELLNEQTSYANKTREILGKLVRTDEFSKVLNNPKLASIKTAFDEFFSDPSDISKLPYESLAGRTLTNENLPDKQVPYEALKNLRSRIGELIADGSLVADISRSELKRMYGAVTSDIQKMAQNTGALKEFRLANKFTTAGHGRLDALSGPLNKQLMEKVFEAVVKGGQGVERINAFKRSMKPEEWEVVAANVIRRLGRSSDGFQDDLGQEFSVNKFLTDWNKLGTENNQKAIRAVFSGSPKLERMKADLDVIASISSRIQDDLRVLANASGTGPFTMNAAALAGAAASFGSGNIPGGLLIGAGVLANNAMAKLMTNQRFIRWLAEGMERVPEQKYPGYIGKLAAIAATIPQEQQMAVQEYLDALDALAPPTSILITKGRQP